MTDTVKEKKKLRSGYTTGACAAAAAKGAVLYFTGAKTHSIEIPFPDSTRHSFTLQNHQKNETTATVSTIKDAGDDPDVTNGALIEATASFEPLVSKKGIEFDNIILFAGVGVGVVTKPGLAVASGEPAINPVPRQMIAQAVNEALSEVNDKLKNKGKLCITISVPNGVALAEKTLNARLGIIGGISILGTTGIVKPVSAEAWKATITTSMDVAKEVGLTDIVISTGRTSEKGVQKVLDLSEEAYAMMGDYLEFSLIEAAKRTFSRIHYAGMWAKVMKGALQIPQTHVRNGAIEIAKGADLLKGLGAGEELYTKFCACNTAREMLEILTEHDRFDLVKAVCHKAQDYAEKCTGLPVHIYLINHKSEVIYHT